MQLKLNPDGWNDVELTIRGDQIEGSFNQHRLRALRIDDTPSFGTSHYGMVGLHIAGGTGAELRVKDISFADLTGDRLSPLRTPAPNSASANLLTCFIAKESQRAI